MIHNKHKPTETLQIIITIKKLWIAYLIFKPLKCNGTNHYTYTMYNVDVTVKENH